MALIDLPLPTPRFSIRRRLAALADSFGRLETLHEDADTERRDFLLEMLDEHCEALGSESDFHCMMHVYAGRF